MLVKDFIKDVMVSEYKSMTIGHDGYATHPYVGFLLLSIGFEFLGACYDKEPWEKRGQSEKRFRYIINKHFPSKYKKINKRRSIHDLYSFLRNPLIHQIRPGINLGLTERKHEEKAGLSNKHLTVQDGKLLLIYEDLFNDFNKVCNLVIEDIETNQIESSKAYGHILSVPNDK